MKRIAGCVFSLLMVLSLLGCGGTAEKPAETGTATEAEIAHLEQLYAGRTALHGELHDHAAGENSDGKYSLTKWKDMMLGEKDMDFAALVNHEQLNHMHQPDWDGQYFIGGSEPGTVLDDMPLTCTSAKFDYSMMFADADAFESVLTAFPNFYYSDGFFQSYKIRQREEFCQVVKAVQDAGGFMNFVHPFMDGYMVSSEPLDYWFGNNVGFEVLNGLCGNADSTENRLARDCWVKLLDAGKRVFATAGSDSHQLSNTETLTTVYSPAHNSKDILQVIRTGDFTAGPVGIRMCIGNAVTGGVCSFAGQTLTVAVGDAHSRQLRELNKYRLEIYTDKGLVFRQELSRFPETEYVTVTVDPDSRYYRAELFDITAGYTVAIGNPIWNEALYTGEVIQ